MSQLSVGGFIQLGTTITVTTTGPHGLKSGNKVSINFASGTGTNGIYTVVKVPDATQFTITAMNSVNQTTDGLSVYPLMPPPVDRHGSVVVQYRHLEHELH